MHHPEVTDLLVTGGDPSAMKTSKLRRRLEPVLQARPAGLRTIRIGSKALGYWRFRFTHGKGADELLRSFEEIVGKGYHVALTAHFSHPVEMGPAVVRTAVKRIQSTGAIIRTQAAIVRHVNDSADAWTILWRTAVSMGMVPYYVFIPRDTGPRRYLQVPPAEARRVFRRAFRRVSGLARTVRGTVHVGPPGQGSTARCQQDRWSQSVRPAVPVGEKPGLGG